MQYIALAENHPHYRGLISSKITELSGYGLSVIAESGFQLIMQLRQLTVLPSIAIIDVEMPEMDGVATTHFLTTHYPTIHVLAISLHKNPALIKQLLHVGAVGFLTKDNLPNKPIEKAFDSIHSGSIFIDESITEYNMIISSMNHTINKQIPHPHLTEKEKLYLQLSAATINNTQIAELMGVAVGSLTNFQKTLKEKIGFGTRHELAIYAIQQGIAKIAIYNNPPPPPQNITSTHFK